MRIKPCHHGVPGTLHNSQTYLSWYSLNSILKVNPPSFFTKLLHKCPEVTGTFSQVFSFAKDFGTMVLNLIQTKTIATLGTVTPRSTTLQYLFDPLIHHDLTRNPTTIIGNSFNKQGEFSLVKVDIASFHLFPYDGPSVPSTPFYPTVTSSQKNFSTTLLI